MGNTRTLCGIHTVKPGLGGNYDEIALMAKSGTSLQIDAGVTLLL